MSLKQSFVEAGQLSPLATAGIYAGISVGLNLLTLLAPTSVLLAFIMLLLWAAASVVFFIVVTWFRDEDWLASGFLLGVPLILSVFIANAVAQAVAEGSVAPLVGAAPSAFLSVIVRGIILIPLAGGAVAAGRWFTTTKAETRRPPGRRGGRAGFRKP